MPAPSIKNGSVFVAKALADHEVWHLDPFSRGQAWMDLLLLANDADRTFLASGRPVQLFRGQLGWSLKSLARRWRWSDEKVAGYMQWLERAGMISRRSNGVTTIITLNNYETYNPADTEPDAVPVSGADTEPATKTATASAAGPDTEPATVTEQKWEVGSKEEGNTHSARAPGGPPLAEAVAFGAQPKVGIPTEAVEHWWNRKVNSLDHGFATVLDWRLDLVTWWRLVRDKWQKQSGAAGERPVSGRHVPPALNTV